MSLGAVAIAMHHSPLGGTDKLVLMGIANHAGDDDTCWPSLEALAIYGHTTTGGVRESLRRLEAAGVIEIYPGKGGLWNDPPEGRPDKYKFRLRCNPGCNGRTHDYYS